MTHVVRTQPRRCLGGWRTLARWLSVCLSAGVVGSCTRDNVTSPSGSPRVPGDTPSRTTTTLGTYTMPIAATNTDNNGALSLTPTGYIIPANSYFRIRIRGNVILTSNPAYIAAYGSNCCSENGTYGPGGTAYVNELRVQAQIKYTDNSGTVGINFPGLGYGPSAPDSAVSAITFTSKQAEVWIGRNGVNGSQNDNCCHWNIGMYSMAGSQTATVEVLTDFVHLTPSPVYKKAGQVVHFQMALDDGTPATVWQWSWTKDPGSNANPLSGCANGWDFCNGTVWGPGTLSGRTDYGWASARVNVYNNFTVTADTTSVHRSDSVTFTSKYDGVPGPAARWSWIPDDTSSDHAGCPDGSSGCPKLIHGPGKMWAFTATSGGDSAYVHIAVVPHKKLILSPSDTIWVATGSTQEFVATGEGGAAVLNSQWSGSDLTFSANRIANRPSFAVRPSPGGKRRQSFGNASSSTCADGVTDCTDMVNGSYVRTVTAVVDDSTQSQSVVVAARSVPQPDSTDTAVGDSAEVSEDGTAPWCFIPNLPFNKYKNAYCKGKPPTGTVLIRIRNALDSMRTKPAPCDTLAQIGDSVLAHGRLRVYPAPTDTTFGGAAPQGGGWSGGNSWMVLSDAFTNVFYDRAHPGLYAAHPGDIVGNFNVWLQGALAHELDHLKGEDHVLIDPATGKRDGRITPHMFACGGTP